MDDLERRVAEIAAQKKQRKNSVPKGLEEHTFKPGQSGNPNGRPKGSVSLVTLLKQLLADVDPVDRKTKAEQLVDSTFRAALKGDPQARKLVWSYIEGDPKQTVELSGGFDVTHLTDTELDRRIAELAAELGYSADVPSVPSRKTGKARAKT